MTRYDQLHTAKATLKQQHTTISSIECQYIHLSSQGRPLLLMVPGVCE